MVFIRINSLRIQSIKIDHNITNIKMYQWWKKNERNNILIAITRINNMSPINLIKYYLHSLIICFKISNSYFSIYLKVICNRLKVLISMLLLLLIIVHFITQKNNSKIKVLEICIMDIIHNHLLKKSIIIIISAILIVIITINNSNIIIIISFSSRVFSQREIAQTILRWKSNK